MFLTLFFQKSGFAGFVVSHRLRERVGSKRCYHIGISLFLLFGSRLPKGVTVHCLCENLGFDAKHTYQNLLSAAPFDLLYRVKLYLDLFVFCENTSTFLNDLFDLLGVAFTGF